MTEIDHECNAEYTAAKGALKKINLGGCKHCPRIFVSKINSDTLGIDNGWYDPTDLSELSGPADKTNDFVFRIRGRKKGKSFGGLKDCGQHK
jgi:hypothetical protein